MKLAVISTVWFPLSHTDVIVTRWLNPYPGDEKHGWNKPESRIASIHIEQFPANDIGRKLCASAGLPLFDSVRGALTLGGDELAVDGVLLIGEHGDYPTNEYYQKLYPRKRLFDAIAAVFRETGRSVPIFNDKHLSWSFQESREMVETARELGFPLYAGSNIPHCRLEPGAPLCDGEAVTEALTLFSGDPEHYGFHIIEFAISLLERRPGGETGIRSVCSLNDQGVRDAIASGEIAEDLLLDALALHGFPARKETIPFILDRTDGLIAYRFEHRDGVRTTHLLIPKFVSSWIVTVRTAGGEIRSCQSVAGSFQDFFSNFACLNARLEEFFTTGKTPTPLLRTHLAAGALEAALHALVDQPGKTVETPQLNVVY